MRNKSLVEKFDQRVALEELDNIKIENHLRMDELDMECYCGIDNSAFDDFHALSMVDDGYSLSDYDDGFMPD